MTSANRYATSWENFWSATTGAPGEIFWDADPTHAAQQDLALFKAYANSQLPLIDLGCGNGTQTRYLANHFAKVIGAEIAHAAVQLAERTNGAANVTYRVLDVLRPDDAQHLYDEIGDAIKVSNIINVLALVILCVLAVGEFRARGAEIRAAG